MRRFWILLGWTVLVVLVAAPDALALRNHPRSGWVLGLGYGGGMGKFTAGGGAPVDPAVPAGESSDPERGAAPQVRLGHMLGRHLLIGVNYEGWLHEQGDVTEKNRFSLQNLTLAATVFPGNPANATGGIFLRAGAGLGWGRYAVVPLEEVDGVLTQQHGEATDESGLGLAFGAGYEFRITDHCAAGLGISANYLSISKEIYKDGLYVPVAVNVNWYF